MATLRGSVFKRSRRLGFSILETGKEFAKGKGRQTVPGQHGNKRRPKLWITFIWKTKNKIHVWYYRKTI